MAEQQIKGVKINGTAYSFEDNSIGVIKSESISWLTGKILYLPPAAISLTFENSGKTFILFILLAK